MMNESHVTVCRLCMGHGEGMLPISTGQPNYTKLILVFQLKLLKRVGVPSHICCVCVDRLDAAHQFKQQILNVGKTLQALYGKPCITKAKSKLVEGLAGKQADFENGGEVPISFAEIDTRGREAPDSTDVDLEASEIMISVTNNNQDVHINDEVDPIAIDNEDTTCLVNGIIKDKDCTSFDPTDTSFVYVSTKTEMDYVSIVDHIDPPPLEEILEANKQKEVEDSNGESTIGELKSDIGKKCCCLVCGKKYSNVPSFAAHMRTQHGSVAGLEYRCVFCKDAFINKKKLKSHRCPANMSKNSFTGHVKCSRCGKLFSVLKDLKEHITNVHMHKCSLCDKRYNQESGLINHMERIHSNEDRSRNITNNEGETDNQRKANIMKKENEKNVHNHMTPQLHMETPNCVTSKIVEPVMKIDAEDLAETLNNQQHLQITDDLPFTDNHVFVKEEVDLGTETIGTLTIQNHNDSSQVNHHELVQTPQSMVVNTGGNDGAVWQTVFPFKVEPFFDKPNLMDPDQELDTSHFDETETVDRTVQKEDEKNCCCLLCNESFQYLSEFIEHMTNHDGKRLPKPDRVPCKVCRKGFLTTSHYKRHLIRGKCPKTPVSAQTAAARAKQAAKEAAIQAARTAAANKSAVQFKKKQAMWKELERNSVKCTVCSKTFTQTKELEIHLRDHRPKYFHKKPRQELSCSYCDKGFNLKTELNHHIKKLHFICVNPSSLVPSSTTHE